MATSHDLVLRVRVAPLTRAQCAVCAVMSHRWERPTDIWRKGPRFTKNGRSMHDVTYGTVCSASASWRSGIA